MMGSAVSRLEFERWMMIHLIESQTITFSQNRTERIMIHLRQLVQNMTQSNPTEARGSQSEYMTVNDLAAVRDTGLSYLKRMLRIAKEQQ